MDFKGQHILSTDQFDKDSLLDLFETAKKMEMILDEGDADLCKGKLFSDTFL